jgi:predicted transcriptional regulator
MKELTKAEEQIMQILWKLKKGFVNDILDQLNEPKPAYNTVSTIVRILEKKGFVGYKAYGKTHEYYPLVSRKEYSKNLIKNLTSKYFSNSYAALTSFFAKEQNLGIHELQEIKELIEEEIKNKKEKND